MNIKPIMVEMTSNQLVISTASNVSWLAKESVTLRQHASLAFFLMSHPPSAWVGFMDI